MADLMPYDRLSQKRRQFDIFSAYLRWKVDCLRSALPSDTHVKQGQVRDFRFAICEFDCGEGAKTHQGV